MPSTIFVQALLLDVDESDVEEAIETFKPISMLSVTNDVFHFCSTPSNDLIRGVRILQYSAYP